MNKTLLEKAKERKMDKRVKSSKATKEDIELALAWVNNEVSMTQVGHALDTTNSMKTYIFLSLTLKSHLTN